MTPRVATVTARTEEAGDVITLVIEVPGGSSPFMPGQFTMLTAFGVGEIPVSISGDAAQPEQLVYTIREVGAVSQALTKLRPGDQLGVRGPFGTGWPVKLARGRDVIIVAGGLGIAPLRPAIYHILANRKDYAHVAIVYGARSPDDILLADELKQWSARDDIDVEITVDHAGLDWAGHVGVVTRLIPEVVRNAGNSVAMVCGPEIMMRYAMNALVHEGLAEENVFLSMERNMKCAVRLCGHCQFGPYFICKDGPVFSSDRIKSFLLTKEL